MICGQDLPFPQIWRLRGFGAGADGSLEMYSGKSLATCRKGNFTTQLTHMLDNLLE